MYFSFVPGMRGADDAERYGVYRWDRAVLRYLKAILINVEIDMLPSWPGIETFVSARGKFKHWPALDWP